MSKQRARREFTVEVKATGPRRAATIPTRSPKPVQTSGPPVAGREPPPILAEARPVRPVAHGRVLPSLILPNVPQVVAGPALAPEPRLTRVRRLQPQPAPRKSEQAPKVRAETPVMTPPVAPLAQAAPTQSVVRLRHSRRGVAFRFRLGERWKWRLSRWSR